MEVQIRIWPWPENAPDVERRAVVSFMSAFDVKSSIAIIQVDDIVLRN